MLFPETNSSGLGDTFTGTLSFDPLQKAPLTSEVSGNFGWNILISLIIQQVTIISACCVITDVTFYWVCYSHVEIWHTFIANYLIYFSIYTSQKSSSVNHLEKCQFDVRVIWSLTLTKGGSKPRASFFLSWPLLSERPFYSNNPGNLVIEGCQQTNINLARIYLKVMLADRKAKIGGTKWVMS